MAEWWQQHGDWVTWLTAASAAMFVVSLLMIPPLVARMPPDYFTRRRRERVFRPGRHPAVGYLILAAKNLLGCFFLLAGMAMLVLPGQGVVTMLIGLLFLDFPGKFRLERKLVGQPAVFRALNWIRARAGRPPLLPPRVRARTAQTGLPAEGSAGSAAPMTTRKP